MMDLKFTDLFGTWHHLGVPVTNLTPSMFQNGLGFDGSSIRCWEGIENSDMVMVPDPTTAVVDPFYKHKTVSFVCDIQTPDGKGYDRDPRNIVFKAHKYLQSTGIASYYNVGPEAEFFIFDSLVCCLPGSLSVRLTVSFPTYTDMTFKVSPNESSYRLDSMFCHLLSLPHKHTC